MKISCTSACKASKHLKKNGKLQNGNLHYITVK